VSCATELRFPFPRKGYPAARSAPSPSPTWTPPRSPGTRQPSRPHVHHPRPELDLLNVLNPNSGQPKQQGRIVTQARGLAGLLRRNSQTFKRSRALQLRRAEQGQDPGAARSKSKSLHTVGLDALTWWGSWRHKSITFGMQYTSSNSTSTVFMHAISDEGVAHRCNRLGIGRENSELPPKLWWSPRCLGAILCIPQFWTTQVTGMVRVHKWSDPGCNPATRTLGRDDDRPHDAEDGLRRGMSVRSTSTRRSSKRDQNSCHCPNVTVLITPARALPCGRASDLAS